MEHQAVRVINLRMPNTRSQSQQQESFQQQNSSNSGISRPNGENFPIPSSEITQSSDFDRSQAGMANGSGITAPSPLLTPSITMNGSCDISDPTVRILDNVQDLVSQMIESSVVQEQGLVSDDHVVNCQDVNALRASYVEMKRQSQLLKMHIKLTELREKLSRQSEDHALEKLSLKVASREEILRDISELVEQQFSCSICNEIFISPVVTKCGHTYCDLCLSRWTRENNNCPICRAVIYKESCKHVEIENFISKFYLKLSEENQTARSAVVTERRLATSEFQRTYPTQSSASSRCRPRLRGYMMETLEGLGLNVSMSSSRVHQRMDFRNNMARRAPAPQSRLITPIQRDIVTGTSATTESPRSPSPAVSNDEVDSVLRRRRAELIDVVFGISPNPNNSERSSRNANSSRHNATPSEPRNNNTNANQAPHGLQQPPPPAQENSSEAAANISEPVSESNNNNEPNPAPANNAPDTSSEVGPETWGSIVEIGLLPPSPVVGGTVSSRQGETWTAATSSSSSVPSPTDNSPSSTRRDIVNALNIRIKREPDSVVEEYRDIRDQLPSTSRGTCRKRSSRCKNKVKRLKFNAAAVPDSDSDEEREGRSQVTYFTCRKCPGLLLTEEQTHEHKEWHREIRRRKQRHCSLRSHYSPSSNPSRS